MILYFSATGNTRFVAKELAKALDDEAMDLCGRIKEHNYETIRSDKPFVFALLHMYVKHLLFSMTFSGMSILSGTVTFI